MRTILLLSLLFPVLLLAQEQDYQKAKIDKPMTFSAFGNYSEPLMAGVSMEFVYAEYKKKRFTALMTNVSAGMMTLESDVVGDIEGTGIVVELGTRTYYQKGKAEGIYTESFLTYGNINFEEDTPLGTFDGRYAYWSLVNGNVGYKITLGDFCIDPSIGFAWKWEVKGRGDIDNKEFNNLVWRAGLKLGYRFN